MVFQIPYTDAEWSDLIAKVSSLLPSPIPLETQPTPAPTSIPSTIDHTLLALSATRDQITTLCTEAATHSFATVCVRADHVEHAVRLSRDADKKFGVAAVVGFHEGTYRAAEKVVEAQRCVADGATELDMVLNWPLLKEGKYSFVAADVKAVRDAAPRWAQPSLDESAKKDKKEKVQSGPDTVLKVILETAQLSTEEIVAGSVISVAVGADFIKTSTGFCGRGALVEDVGLMRAVAEVMEQIMGDERERAKVKASGGVRSAEDVRKMVRAGAERIGASAGVAIAKEVLAEEKGEVFAKDESAVGNGY